MMTSKFLKAVLSVVLAASAFAASAEPLTVTKGDEFGSNDGASINHVVTAPGAGSGVLTFDVFGNVTLDGENCCTDIFTFAFNGTTMFSGTFAMGGGGNNVVYFSAPGVTVVSTEQFGFGVGGVTRFSFAHDLVAGANTYSFAYSPLQAFEDESWVLANFRLEAEVDGGPSVVPEPGSLALLGLGLFGFAAARRRKN